MAKTVLAFDFGASSGRAMLGSFQNGKIAFHAIHRFENNPVNLNGTLYWDFPYLFQQIKVGITQAKKEGGFDSIAVDTWPFILSTQLSVVNDRLSHIMVLTYKD